MADISSSNDPFHDQAGVTDANSTTPTGEHPQQALPSVGQPPNPENLVPSTRPSMPENRALSQLSNVPQAPSTPNSEISIPPPVGTPTEALEAANVDPKVAALQAMFPDLDVGILQMVLEASGGDQDHAIEMLLSMSDPEYKPPTAAVHQQASQDDLDEQLARRLYLEDQAAQQAYEQRTSSRAYEPRRNPPARQNTSGATNTNLIPNDVANQVKNFFSGAQAKIAGAGFGRGGAGNNPQGTEARGPQPDYQQQFNEVAETGKKYFNTFVSKVKAKMQEYDGAPSPGQQGMNTQGNMQGVGYGNYGQGAVQTTAHAPYYPSPAPIDARSRQQSYTPMTPDPMAGYHVEPATPVSPSSQTMQPASPGPALVSSGLGIAPPLAQRSSFDQGDASPPNFDTSRFGLKPKRPVSLVGPSATTAKGKDNAANDDDIEYVESPFEDRR